MRFLLIIFKIVTLYSPLKIFFPVSAARVLPAGLAYGVWNVVRPRQDPHGRGAPDPARGRGLPVRPHLGADRVGAGTEVTGGGSTRRATLVLALLAVLPVVAHAPRWWEDRLLGPGDGAVLHFPCCGRRPSRPAAGELPVVEPGHLLGHAAPRGLSAPGALYPPMLALSRPRRPSSPSSSSCSAPWPRRASSPSSTCAGSERAPSGPTSAGCAFASAPTSSATSATRPPSSAAPLLPLLLLAAESHVDREAWPRRPGFRGPRAAARWRDRPRPRGPAAPSSLGRLLVAHLFPHGRADRASLASLLAVAPGLLLAAPQLLPTFSPCAKPGRAGHRPRPPDASPPLPGLTGLVLRYVSHTPAPALALAALPLAVHRDAAAGPAVAAAFSVLGLQWGRGPLAAPGALALVFDFDLAAPRRPLAVRPVARRDASRAGRGFAPTSSSPRSPRRRLSPWRPPSSGRCPSPSPGRWAFSPSPSSSTLPCLLARTGARGRALAASAHGVVPAAAPGTRGLGRAPRREPLERRTREARGRAMGRSATTACSPSCATGPVPPSSIWASGTALRSPDDSTANGYDPLVARRTSRVLPTE